MKVPVEWLEEYIDTGLPPAELCDRLTLAGLEVEGVEGEGRAAVLDVNVTPNRPDTLSLFGIARELGAILGLPVKRPAVELREDGPPPDAVVEIQAPDLCARYAARVIRGVRVGPSPEWLVRRLEAVGIRPINNVVDVTNYVLMEMGHPMHAFDLAAVRDRRLLVRRAEEGEEIRTLDGVGRRLDGEMLTIRDAGGPLAVAGVMGGMDSEVSGETRDVLLESAYFSPPSVRRTSRKLGLRSESSYRFERGTDIEGLIFALDRAAALVADLAGGEVAAGRIDLYPSPYDPPSITLERENLARLLGTTVPEKEISGILERLGFSVTPGGDGVFSVRPPSWRRDVSQAADLVEEVARLWGYDRIPSRLPSGGGAPERIAGGSLRDREGRIREGLRHAGFSEAVHYSFMNPAHLDALGFSGGDPRRNLVELANPLRSEEAALRSTLLPALLGCLSLNRRRGADEVRIFELSRTFSGKADAGPPEEVRRLGVVYAPGTSKSLHGRPAHGFFVLKGVLEQLVADLRVTGLSVRASEAHPYLDSACAADVLLDDDPAGCIGALSPEVRDRFEIDTEAFFLDLDVSVFDRHVPGAVRFRRWPKFPPVDRDMALLLPLETPAASVEAAIRGFGSKLIRSVRLFDVYLGKGVPEGKKSLAFAVRYQSPDRTLTVQEVDAEHGALLEHLRSSLGAVLRA